MSNLDRRRGYTPRRAREQRAYRLVVTGGAAGALGRPPSGGAIVFRGVERQHVEAFVSADPYVRAGLVTSWRVEPWNLV